MANRDKLFSYCMLVKGRFCIFLKGKIITTIFEVDLAVALFPGGVKPATIYRYDSSLLLSNHLGEGLISKTRDSER